MAIHYTSPSLSSESSAVYLSKHIIQIYTLFTGLGAKATLPKQTVSKHKKININLI